MYEICIKVGRYWENREEELITRVADCILGRHVSSNNRPRLNDARTIKESSYRWELDSTNDWKAEIRLGELFIAYRYGGGYEEMMKGLKAFLSWELR